mmetsp:Transcript_81735/g.243737  ORF Transcript_81735/g.243737 Transcript_81735/m.243737 type:complete len:305 (-) Transcript_81735:1139-2053(-)
MQAKRAQACPCSMPAQQAPPDGTCSSAAGGEDEVAEAAGPPLAGGLKGDLEAGPPREEELHGAPPLHHGVGLLGSRLRARDRPQRPGPGVVALAAESRGPEERPVPGGSFDHQLRLRVHHVLVEAAHERVLLCMPGLVQVKDREVEGRKDHRLPALRVLKAEGEGQVGGRREAHLAVPALTASPALVQVPVLPARRCEHEVEGAGLPGISLSPVAHVPVPHILRAGVRPEPAEVAMGHRAPEEVPSLGVGRAALVDGHGPPGDRCRTPRGCRGRGGGCRLHFCGRCRGRHRWRRRCGPRSASRC